MATFKQGDKVTHPLLVGEWVVTFVYLGTTEVGVRTAPEAHAYFTDDAANFTPVRRPIALGDKVRAQGDQPAGIVAYQYDSGTCAVRFDLKGEAYNLTEAEVYERRVED